LLHLHSKNSYFWYSFNELASAACCVGREIHVATMLHGWQPHLNFSANMTDEFSGRFCPKKI
jgi:hypothetical protein